MTIIRAVLSIIAAGLLACFGVAVYVFTLLKRRPPQTLYMHRSVEPDFLPLDQIPPRLIELIIENEDKNFYTHPGYDIEAIRKARQLNRRKKRIVWGASTITQQLAKNLYLRFRKSYLRKLAELLIAVHLERTLGKKRILEMYLNTSYFGNGAYGVVSAAQFYFHKRVRDLSLNQMVMLTALLPVPTIGNPIQHPKEFELLRNKYLAKAAKNGRPSFSQAEVEAMRSYGIDSLDPELRKPDDFTRNYPQTIPMINERFGPFSDAGDKHPTAPQNDP